MTLFKILLIGVLLCAAVAGYALYAELQKARSEDPTVWEEAIIDFEHQLRKAPAKPGSIVFIGSSSIRLWDSLAEDMKPFSVVQRGFGGAKFLDAVHYAERLIDIGTDPAAIVLFIGSNDISPGDVKDPNLLLQRYQEFIAIVRATHADVPVYYIAITPSILRWSVWDAARQTNHLIREFSNSEKNLFVVDTSSALLGDNGEPDPKLYQLDGLHLSPAGYVKWTSILLPRLLSDIELEDTH